MERTNSEKSTLTLKRTVKDSVFRDIFSDRRYLFQLYQALHPEDTHTTPEDLRLVTLETVLASGIYNDLGFMVGDRLLILAEAQSTWSVNMIVRSLLYLSSTYQDYFDASEQSLYATKPVKLPEPELYVIYTGQSQVSKKELSLSEEFFGGKQTALEVHLKVIAQQDSDDIINQYIIFCKVINEQVQRYGRTQEALLKAMQICKNRNVLREYLQRHEKEAVDIMMELYNQERIWNQWGASQYAEGRAEGHAMGRAEERSQMTMAMYTSGIPLEQIAKIANESLETVRAWIGLQ